MTFFARPLRAILVLFAVLVFSDAALAIEEVVEGTDRFGIRGSIHESTALVGQRFGGTDGNGEVQVFKLGSETWPIPECFLADLLPPGALSTGADFGAGALVIDGEVAIAAAHRNEVEGVSEAGSVFLFSRSGSTWSYDDQWTEPLPPGATASAANAQFGIAGDLDGDRALIVAGGTNVAYVYKRDDDTWDSGMALTGGSLSNPIAAAIDDEVAVVGTFVGNAHLDVWRFNEETWHYETQIPNPGTDNLFATDVDISGDTIVVSAYDQDVAGQVGAGAVYVYHYDDGSSQWVLQQMVENPDPAPGDAFGYGVAIDGDRLIVGAPRHDSTEVDVGAAYLFERTGSTWLEVTDERVEGDIAGRWFGETVAVGDLSLLIGGSGRTTEPVGQGMVQLEGPSGVFIPGDANRDDKVDWEDAAILADNWGATDDVRWTMGDFNNDGKVDMADAAILAANWGYGTEGESCASVPEPSMIALLAGTLLGLAALRRPKT